MSQDLSQNKKQAGRRGQELALLRAGQNHDNTGTHIGGITDNDIDTAYQDALRWIHSSMRFDPSWASSAFPACSSLWVTRRTTPSSFMLPELTERVQ